MVLPTDMSAAIPPTSAILVPNLTVASLTTTTTTANIPSIAL